LVPKLVTSFFRESNTDAEVVGNKLPISLENIMPPRITIPTSMPNLMNIYQYYKKLDFRFKLKKIIKKE
jgi:hypothetical protein